MMYTAVRRSEFTLCALLFILILAFWQIFIGHPLTNLYGAGDSVGVLAHYSEVLRSGWLASDFIYTSTRFGGSPAGVLDFPVYMQLAGFLKLHPVLAMNLAVTLTQTFVAYLCLSIPLILEDRRWYQESLLIPFSILFALSPSLGWRLYYGHLNMAWGLLWALAIFYLGCCASKNRFSVTGLIICFLVFANSFQCINLAQPILYGALVLVLFTMLYFRKTLNGLRRKSLLLPAFLVVAGLAYSLVNLANIRELMSHLARTENTDLIYTYNVQTLADFLSSFFSGVHTIRTGRSEFMLHETNLALGIVPFITLSLTIVLKNYRLLTFHSLLLIIGVVLSSDIPVLSDFFVSLIPILSRFRCPSRIFIFISYAQLISLFVLCIRNRIQFSAKRTLILLLPLLMLILPLNVLVSLDIPLTVMAATLSIIYCFRSEEQIVSVILGMCCFLGVAGFQDRRITQVLTRDSIEIEAEFFNRIPEITRSLLSHTSSRVLSGNFGENQSAAYGFSGVDGYAYPLRRFFESISVIYPQTQSTTYVFHFDSTRPGFDYFKKVFNVVRELNLNDGSLFADEIRKSTESFSPSEIRIEDTAAATVMGVSGLSEDDFQRIVFVEGQFSEDVMDLIPCETKVLQSDLTRATIQVRSKGKCLIVTPTQFSPFLKATSRDGKEFKTIPVNWIMTGIIVERSLATDIILAPAPALAGEMILKIIAVLILGILIYLVSKKKLRLNE